MTELAEFKTNAWKARASADTYHEATAAADKGFQLVRRDLYIKYLQEFVPAGKKILDVGCGSGIMAMALHDLGYQTTDAIRVRVCSSDLALRKAIVT